MNFSTCQQSTCICSYSTLPWLNPILTIIAPIYREKEVIRTELFKNIIGKCSTTPLLDLHPLILQPVKSTQNSVKLAFFKLFFHHILDETIFTMAQKI